MSKKAHETALPKLRFRDVEAWDLLNGNRVFDQITNKNHKSDLPILAITQEHGAIPRELIDYNVVVMDKSLEGYKVVEKGDFIISLRSFQGGIEYSTYKGICSPAYIILRRKKEGADAYFKHYFKTPTFIANLNKNIEGLRDGKMVSYKQFSELLLPIPSPLEQQKIAVTLSSLDALLTAQTAKLTALQAHKRGLMQDLFPAEGKTMPKRRFPEFREAGEWNIQPLGKVAKNLDNKRVPITEGQRIKGNVPYYGATGIIDYVQNFIFNEELLCISEDGANLIARTYPIAFSITGKTWVNNHAHVLRFEQRYTQVVIQNYLNAINLEDFLTGVAQPKLNRAKLDVIPIPLPKKAEQQKIADCLSSLDNLITAQSQKIDALKQHKKGLMQTLFPAASEPAA